VKNATLGALAGNDLRACRAVEALREIHACPMFVIRNHELQVK
jgi:hypothetical protein